MFFLVLNTKYIVLIGFLAISFSPRYKSLFRRTELSIFIPVPVHFECVLLFELTLSANLFVWNAVPTVAREQQLLLEEISFVSPFKCDSPSIVVTAGRQMKQYCNKGYAILLVSIACASIPTWTIVGKDVRNAESWLIYSQGWGTCGASFVTTPQSRRPPRVSPWVSHPTLQVWPKTCEFVCLR